MILAATTTPRTPARVSPSWGWPDGANATGRQAAFSCPLCPSSSYARVIYTMTDGRRIAGSFYRCSGCLFGFTDPSVFARAGET